MTYIRINGAVFEQTPTGMLAVSDANTLAKIRNGQLPIEDRAASSSDKYVPAPLVPKADLSGGSQSAGGLTGFYDALNRATDLARAKRNQLFTQTLGKQFGGTLRASDFAAILDSVNSNASDVTSTLVKQFGSADDVLTVDEARALGVPYGTTKKEAAEKGITPRYQPTSSDEADAEIGSISKQLEGARGEDGYTDPNLYARLRTAAKVSPTEFDNRFGYLVNPASKSHLGIDKAASGLTNDQLANINEAKAALDAWKQAHPYQDFTAIRDAIIQRSKSEGFDLSPYI